MIVPTVLAKDISKFEEDLRRVEGFARKVQMDIVDGKFIPFETVTPEVLLTVETPAEIEAHLMVEDPAEWVKRCVAAGITAVYGQVEKMPNVADFIAKAEEAGMRTGLAYELTTPLGGLEEWVNLVDGVLLMSVEVGAQGQAFDQKVLERIKKVRDLSPTVVIMIDGGLNEDNIKRCLRVGGEKIEFAVGSQILTASDPEDCYRRLEEIE